METAGKWVLVLTVWAAGYPDVVLKVPGFTSERECLLHGRQLLEGAPDPAETGGGALWMCHPPAVAERL